GAKACIICEVALQDYNLDIRYEHGNYRHNIFDNLYSRNRTQNLAEIWSERMSPSTETIHKLNIYGEAGFNILNDKVRFMTAYLWPWEYDGSTIRIADADSIKAGLEISKGVVPVYDISGAIYYERRGFVPALQSDNFTFFNAETILSGEIVMPLAPTLDLALVASTTTVYDEQGNMEMEDDGISPKIVPVFNIETRIHF
nr:hypothetical protein [Spirochaetaceae bacterium]